MGDTRRLCDFCNDSTAIVYCRADLAKLCLACDREVHSTNPLFTKHVRTQLCDACDDAPVTILCSTDDLVLCQNCDWETHDKSSGNSGLSHERKQLEGFSGCPSVGELLVVMGMEEVGKKGLLGDLNEVEGLGGGYGFAEFLTWDGPNVFNLDDLIGGVEDPSQGFSALDAPAPAPPLPKVMNATCGKHKEEILRQLQEMAKSEPGFACDAELVLQPRDLLVDCEHDEKPVIGLTYEENENTLTLFGDSNELSKQVHPSTLSITNTEDGLVPEKQSDTAGCPSHSKTDVLPMATKVYSHEFNSQERDTALSRYKEKKKTRRYDKHIRYESRKVRAESRTRIKGRFAKSTEQ